MTPGINKQEYVDIMQLLWNHESTTVPLDELAFKHTHTNIYTHSVFYCQEIDNQPESIFMFVLQLT